eukprot:9306705-Pyramimonas_sp.AAC.1
MKRRAQARGIQRKVMRLRQLPRPWELRPFLPALRRDAAASVAGAKHGRCLNTALQAVFGVADPGIDLRRQIIKEWVALWLAQPSLRPRIRQLWPRTPAKLRSGESERLVCEVEGACAAPLLRCGLPFCMLDGARRAQ